MINVSFQSFTYLPAQVDRFRCVSGHREGGAWQNEGEGLDTDLKHLGMTGLFWPKGLVDAHGPQKTLVPNTSDGRSQPFVQGRAIAQHHHAGHQLAYGRGGHGRTCGHS